MNYNFSEIEHRWKAYWSAKEVYKVTNDITKPKCYVLDMFPYPSGAGLHVGHPLGYIASDIYARYKRLNGFNVLHPMGFDAFGLPAEQYALETGQHPVDTTEKNIARYREQLDNIGFCYDWSREVRTSDPGYYKWTQWIFLQLFHSWYDRAHQKARPIAELTAIFASEGNINIACPGDDTVSFNANEWAALSEKEQRQIIMHYRLAYQGYAQVWWCEALGTVLANDEVVNGVSERGSHPVERKLMRQWFLRITEYADRLLTSLDNLDWTEAMKEMQRNWIGKSTGAEVSFPLNAKESIEVFTTRPDTIFGVDFLVLAPEHALVDIVTTEGMRAEIDAYRQYVKSRSERERQSEVKVITGCFTGAYAIHPLTHNRIPVWIAEYVLAGYGTGAIMAVPSGDSRDHAFANHFNIPITNIFGDSYTGKEAYSEKAGQIHNSGFLTGMSISEAAEASINALVAINAGKRRVNFRLRDAGFSRQRYWGEPFPIVYVDNIPYGTDEPKISADGDSQLPVTLPFVASYKPGPEGQGPLANLTDWVETMAGMRETNTMPGYAGSSWYFLRYMDPKNDAEFASRSATDYWQQVDLYVGGTEHAVGHLLYSRMWTKALYDLGYIGFDEPFKKLLNQGMIQGQSYFANGFTGHEVDQNGNILGENDPTTFIVSYSKSVDAGSYSDIFTVDGKSYRRVSEINPRRIRNAHNWVDTKDRISKDNYEKLKAAEDAATEVIVLWADKDENGNAYLQCKMEVEKMSKSKYNVVNPDEIVAQYGADTFRMYEMFLGPVDVSKPWDTKGIEGVHRFLKKFWRLFASETGLIVDTEPANEAELRTLHKTLKKIAEDMERFSFNTSVSQFMICVNELSTLGCHKREVLEPLVIALSPFAPHIAEELWQALGNQGSVLDATFPKHDDSLIAESSVNYGVSVNGKKRVELAFPIEAAQSDIEVAVLADPTVQKWMEGKQMKKFIYVKGKMINVVV
jgi:leucyl-tRNA synthetase